MTGHKHYFSNLNEKEFGFEILLGDDYAYHPKGVRTVRFERESGKPLYLSGVLYVHGLKKNLVSVSALEDKGYEVSFKDRRAYIKPRGLSMGSEQVIGVRKDKLYKLQFDSHYILASSNSTRDCELWHRRIAHLGHGALKILGKIMTGMPSFTSEHHEICKGCVLGKFVQAPFPKSESRSKSILYLIHTDIYGPMSSLSIGGKFKYYITFIDDFSRKTWIYFLTGKTSEEVLKRFLEFKALVETQTGKRIKALGYDNGGEYTSFAFKRFCVEDGIKRELAVPYTPQQNGISERKNRAIVGAAKVMLHDQNLPTFLWVEACNTTVYLQNRSPHKVLGNVTPEEAFTRKKPDISHLKIFGCVAYCHIPAKKRTKLDPTAEKGILVGYSETSKAYRVYIPTTRKTVLRRDVKFEEERALQNSYQDKDISEIESPSQEEKISSTRADIPTVEYQEEEIPTTSKKRKPKWAKQLLREASEQVQSPKTSVRTSVPPQRYSGYVALMSNMIESEPTCFEEAIVRKP
jgi:hypothetical protein